MAERVSKRVHADEVVVNRGYASHRTADDVEPSLHLRTLLILVSLCFAAFAVTFGVTATGFWLSYVIGSLGPSPVSVFFATAWQILQVGITPVFGQITDFGPRCRKWSCVGLSGVAVVGLIVAGSATDWRVAIFGSTLFGAAVVTYGPQAAIASDIVPRRMRGLVQGVLYASQALGSLTACLGGGAMIRDNIGGAGGWRWVLYLDAILLGTSALGIGLLYRPISYLDPLDTTSRRERTFFNRLVQDVDWMDALLLNLGMVPFLLGVFWGGNKYPWLSPAPIASLVVGGGFLLLFAAHQVFLTRTGIFAHRLFRNRNFAICLTTIFVEGIVYITLNTFLGQQIGALCDTRPLHVGLHFAVILLCAATSACVAGWYSHRTREIKYPLLIGYAMFVGACIGFSRADARPSSDRLVYGMCGLVGLGLGPPLALLMAAAQLAVDPDQTGIASCLVIGIRSWGGATGSAIASAVFSNKLGMYMPVKVGAAALSAGASTSQIPDIISYVVDTTHAVTPPQGVSEAVLERTRYGLREAYAESFRFIYYEIIPWAVLGFVCLCFLRPTKTAMTWSITTPAESYDKLGVERALDAVDSQGTLASDVSDPQRSACDEKAGAAGQTKETA